MRSLYAALDRGDLSAWREGVAPDMIVDYSRRLIHPWIARGRDDPVGVAAWEEFRDAWEKPPHRTIHELIAAGDNVFASVTVSTRGRGSGVKVDVDVAEVWTFRDGLPIKFVYFGEDRDAALEAAGVSGSGR